MESPTPAPQPTQYKKERKNHVHAHRNNFLFELTKVAPDIGMRRQTWIKFLGRNKQSKIMAFTAADAP
jgi:hypothetical protein